MDSKMNITDYKLALAISIGTIIGSIGSLIEVYLLAEYKLFINIFILVIIDTILGVITAYRNKTISSTGFSKVLTKLVVYILLIIAVNQGHINNPNAGIMTLMIWVDNVVYGSILVREILSILEKAGKLGIITLPAKIKERLAIFEDEVTK